MAPPSLDAAFESEADTLIVLENDLYRRAPAALVNRFLSRFRHVIALDYVPSRTTGSADLVLPAASFAEGDGTLVNNEGRAQRYFKTFIPAPPIQESWRWLGSWQNLDEVLKRLGNEIPELGPAIHAAPLSDFRIAGAKIPREPYRYSGRTAMMSDISVHEPQPPEDVDSPLSFSMEGTFKQPPPSLVPFFWSPGWNSIQSVNKFQTEIAGPLRGGPAGVCLIEGHSNQMQYYREFPESFQIREGEWL